MDEIVKTYLVNLVVNADNATKELNQFTAEVNKTKRALQELMAAGHTLAEANKILGDNLKPVERGFVDTSRGAVVLKTAVDRVGSSMGVFGSQATKTTRILERIFAAAIIGYVLGAIRQLVQGLKDAIEAGAELAKTFLDIQIAARALQRSGLDTTVREWVDLASELEKTFTQFGRADINKGITQLLDLGRVAGLSTAQILELADAIAILATKERLEFAEGVDIVSQVVATGRTQSFRKLVEAMKDTTITNEAVRRGIIKTADEIDEYTRTLAVLAVMQDRVTQVGEDALLIQEDISGQYEANKKDIEEASATIGTELLPTMVKLQPLLLGFLTFLDRAVQGLQLFWAGLLSVVMVSVSLIETIQDLGGAFNVLLHPLEFMTTLWNQFGKAFYDVGNVLLIKK